MRRRLSRALAELGAAAPLGAVCLLAANDHQGKRLFHNAVTGKLSDVAICFLLPLLVSAALGVVCGWSGRRRLAAGAAVAAVVFTALELSDAAGALFVRATGAVGLGGGPLTRDPTDLLALACVPLAVAYGLRRVEAAARGAAAWRSVAGAVVLATASLALMATSPAARCNDWSAPVVFRAEAGCGPGGIIVVEADELIGRLTISNADALGLPPFTTGQGSDGFYRGGSCPYRLAEGDWEVTVEGCASVEGGPPPSRCPIFTAHDCRAAREDGELWFTCGGADGGAPFCRSRLTEAP